MALIRSRVQQVWNSEAGVFRTWLIFKGKTWLYSGSYCRFSLLTLAAELQGYYCCLALSSTALKKSMVGWMLVLPLRKHDWLYESVFSSLDANGAVITGSPSRSFLGPTLDFRLEPTTP